LRGMNPSHHAPADGRPRDNRSAAFAFFAGTKSAALRLAAGT
jgi:hypothetical protein